MNKTKSIYNEEIQNIITIKLDYRSPDTERILDCIKNYNSLFRSTYSFYQQVPDLKQSETTRLQSLRTRKRKMKRLYLVERRISLIG